MWVARNAVRFHRHARTQRVTPLRQQPSRAPHWATHLCEGALLLHLHCLHRMDDTRILAALYIRLADSARRIRVSTIGHRQLDSQHPCRMTIPRAAESRPPHPL
jgi:hypothetical protein